MIPMIDALFRYEFLQHAVLASLLGSIACGIIGTLVVLNRLSSLTGSVAHASFGGLGLSYLIGIPPIIGALIFSLTSALGIASISSRYRHRADTAIAAIWAVGMASGLIFINLAPGYAVDLMSYLFGSILAVPVSDLIGMLVLDVIVLIFVGGFFKELIAISYDPEFSRIQGVRVTLFYTLFLCLTAVTVVMLMRVTGLIMVIALLTIPSAIARIFLDSICRIMILSVLLAAFFCLSGLFLSWYLNLTAGAVIILVAGFFYFIALILQGIRKKGSSPI